MTSIAAGSVARPLDTRSAVELHKRNAIELGKQLLTAAEQNNLAGVQSAGAKAALELEAIATILYTLRPGVLRDDELAQLRQFGGVLQRVAVQNVESKLNPLLDPSHPLSPLFRAGFSVEGNAARAQMAAATERVKNHPATAPVFQALSALGPVEITPRADGKFSTKIGACVLHGFFPRAADGGHLAREDPRHPGPLNSQAQDSPEQALMETALGVMHHGMVVQTDVGKLDQKYFRWEKDRFIELQVNPRTGELEPKAEA